MNTIRSGAADAPQYKHAIDLDTLRLRFDTLIDEVLSYTFSIEALSKALAGGITDAGAILRAVPVCEGRLLEKGIGLIAELNPDLIVLTQNLRLPVTRTALDLVEKNDPKNYRFLTLDADTGGRRGYTPDLILVNRLTRLAHVVDVKRSLGSYEVSRITELKSRMLAAALVVPDHLYREHHRLVAEEVRVVILNAENQRSDIAGGVWPISHLDHLLEISGAGAAIGSLRTCFHSRINENWTQASRSFVRATAETPDIAAAAPAPSDEKGSGQKADGSASPSVKRDSGPENVVGFARIPRTGSG